MDAGIREAEVRLNALPPVASADPLAEGTAKLIVWLTGAGVETVDIQNGRLVALMLLPQLAGLIFAIGAGLWRPRRTAT